MHAKTIPLDTQEHHDTIAMPPTSELGEDEVFWLISEKDHKPCCYPTSDDSKKRVCSINSICMGFVGDGLVTFCADHAPWENIASDDSWTNTKLSTIPPEQHKTILMETFFERHRILRKSSLFRKLVCWWIKPHRLK